MSIEKISALPPITATAAPVDKVLQGRAAAQVAQDQAARQRAAVTSQENSRSSDPVSVSETATNLSQAINSVASEGEDFDQEKVDRIRRDIRSGRFPINEERLARKFMELERELGDLRRK